MTEKFCVECGKKLPMAARFCDACGRRQPEFVVPPELKEVELPEPVKVPPEPVINAPESVHIEQENVLPEKTGEVTEETVQTEDSSEKNEEYKNAAPEPVKEAAPPPYIPPPQVPDSYCQPVPENKTESGMNPLYILLIAFALVAAAILIGAMFAVNKGFINDNSSSSSRVVTFVEPTEKPETTTRPKRTTGGAATEVPTQPTTDDDYFGVGGKVTEVYSDGEYEVGKDIPAGEYIIAASEDEIEFYDELKKQGEYYEPEIHVIVKDGRKDIIRNWYQNHTYVKLKDGQRIEISHADMFSADDSGRKFDPFETSGTFIVGRDVEPGTYELVPISGEHYDSYIVFDNIDDMMAHENDYEMEHPTMSDEDFSLTLKEGQVLILTDCKLKK